MNKNLKGAIVVLLVGGLAYFYYKKANDPRALVVKQLDADFGVDSQHGSFVYNADINYIKAWASAIKSGASTFTYNGKTYNTKGGKSA